MVSVPESPSKALSPDQRTQHGQPRKSGTTIITYLCRSHRSWTFFAGCVDRLAFLEPDISSGIVPGLNQREDQETCQMRTLSNEITSDHLCYREQSLLLQVTTYTSALT